MRKGGRGGRGVGDALMMRRPRRVRERAVDASTWHAHLRLAELLLGLGDRGVVVLDAREQLLALLLLRELRAVELSLQLCLQPAEAAQLLAKAEGLRAHRVALQRALHLARALVEEGEVGLAARDLLQREHLLLLRQLQESLLHRRVHLLELIRELLLMAHQLVLHVARLRLERVAVLEELVDALAVGAVLLPQARRLLEHLVHLAVRARPVEQQVVVGELPLQRAHVVGECLVLALELAVRRVVLLPLLHIRLQLLDLALDLRAFGAQQREEVRLVLDLPRGAVARGAHAREALLRGRPVLDVHVRVQPHA